MRSGAGLAGVGVVLAIASGCSGTKEGPLEYFTVEVEPAEAPHDVAITTSAGVCDDDLRVEVNLEDDDRTIEVDARGTTPDNEFDYCSRYIDTGGDGVDHARRTYILDLPAGAYQIVDGNREEVIEFRYAGGSVETSGIYPSFARRDELADQPQHTDEIVERLKTADPELVEGADCVENRGFELERESYLYHCVLAVSHRTKPRTVTLPVPRELLVASGCTGLAKEDDPPIDPDYDPDPDTFPDGEGDLGPPQVLEWHCNMSDESGEEFRANFRTTYQLMPIRDLSSCDSHEVWERGHAPDEPMPTGWGCNIGEEASAEIIGHEPLWGTIFVWAT